ncbi:Acetyl-CoA:oxalate CoA-transferase [Halioglobus japonicus]|nr:Acetyl-CoA:oxalate CoA-transferase [Halioglobus japonicus]
MNIPEDKATPNGPLHGIKVLDIGSMVAAPLAAGILADQGAEVIKVETPGIGDLTRYVGATCNGVSSIFQGVNRGKRSIAIDLKSESGVEILHRMVREVDVIIHNFRPGVADRLQADYSTLSAINPELIYVSVSGFGHEGPMAQKAAYDNVVQAFAGVAMSQRDAQTGEPAQYKHLFADKLTAMMASQAITAALLARERGAGGQQVKLSMVDVVTNFMWLDAAGTATFKSDNADPGMQISKDSRLIKFKNGYGQAAPVSDSDFHGWCAAFGVDSSDPRLATVIERLQHEDMVNNVSSQIFERGLNLDADETLAKLDDADVPCARANELHELPANPQMQANKLFVESEHPTAGPIVEPRNPVNFSKTPSGCGFPSVALGANTDAILSELGFDNDEIQRMKECGAVM